MRDLNPRWVYPLWGAAMVVVTVVTAAVCAATDADREEVSVDAGGEFVRGNDRLARLLSDPATARAVDAIRVEMEANDAAEARGSNGKRARSGRAAAVERDDRPTGRRTGG